MLKAVADRYSSETVRGTLAACGVALVLIVCTSLGEALRLSAGLRAEARARDAFARSRVRLEGVRVRYHSLRERARTASEVQAVRTSGLREALRLADVARRVPPGVAIASLRHHAGVVSVAGSAANGQALALAMELLSASNRFSDVRLVEAARERSENWHYEFRLTDVAK